MPITFKVDFSNSFFRSRTYFYTLFHFSMKTRFVIEFRKVIHPNRLTYTHTNTQTDPHTNKQTHTHTDRNSHTYINTAKNSPEYHFFTKYCKTTFPQLVSESHPIISRTRFDWSIFI